MKFIRVINANQKVYHCSPYKFNKFDISKIGQGGYAENGWGIYFSFNKPLTAYSEHFTSNNTQDNNQTKQTILRKLYDKKVTKNDLIKESNFYKYRLPEFDRWIKELDEKSIKKSQGYIYTCSVPDKNELYYNDVPFLSQTSSMKNKLNPILKKYNFEDNFSYNNGDPYLYECLDTTFNSAKKASLEFMKCGVPGLYTDTEIVIWDVSKIKILEVK